MLDRVSLSLKNMWIDKSRRVYIIFTLKEVMDTLNCGDKKATRLMGELEKCGLIERDRRGLGKPNLIYVKNFNSGVPPNERFQTRQNDDSGVGNMEIHRTICVERLKLNSLRSQQSGRLQAKADRATMMSVLM